MIKTAIDFALNQIKNPYVKTVLARYLLYTIIAIEVFFLPKILDSESYTSFEYIKNIAFLSPFLLLGIPSGFLFIMYSEKKNVFNAVFSIFLTLSSVLFPILIIAGLDKTIIITSFIMMLYVLLEHYFKVKKQFVYAFSFKPLLALCTVIISLMYSYSNFHLNGIILTNTAFLITILIWIIIGYKKNNFSFQINKESFNETIYALKKGFPISIATALLAILFFSDRYFTKFFFSDYLYEYSFSFNLTQIVIMALTTISYVSVIDIGENIDSIRKKDLRKNLFISTSIFIVLNIFLILGTEFIIPIFYEEFSNLTMITIILLLGKGLFFSVGIIMPVTMYYNFHGRLAFILFLIVIMVIVLNYYFVLFGYSYYYVLFTSSLGLIVYTLICLFIIFRVIEYAEN